jgi:hypothetical protein
MQQARGLLTRIAHQIRDKSQAKYKQKNIYTHIYIKYKQKIYIYTYVHEL